MNKKELIKWIEDYEDFVKKYFFKTGEREVLWCNLPLWKLKEKVLND